MLGQLHAGDVLELGKAVGVHQQGSGTGWVAADHPFCILQVRDFAVRA